MIASGLFAYGTLVSAADPTPGVERFFIGTYSGAIYQSTLNLGTASLGTPSKAVSIDSPSFVALTPDHRFLYAVNENGGTVGAYSVNPTNGVLKLLNQRSSNGGSPAHVVVDRGGRNVIVANYSGGSVTVMLSRTWTSPPSSTTVITPARIACRPIANDVWRVGACDDGSYAAWRTC